MKLEKTTGGGPRAYRDACAAAHALDLLGERWALLVVRELLLGPRRFTDLRRTLPGISANVLTQRLEGLEDSGVLLRRKMPPPFAGQVYDLTEWGREAEPIVRALGRWGARSPRHDPTLPFSFSSLILSLRTMFDAERGQGFKKRVGLQVEERDCLVRVKKGRLVVEDAGLDDADVVLRGAASAVAAAIYGGVSVRTLVDDGQLQMAGDEGAFLRFARLFPLPAKAAAAVDLRMPPS